jgi:PleD family two-component response regulator
MTIPSDTRILVVDAPTTRACVLREALVRAGAKVHVVSSAGAALMLINRLRIHTAFVAYDMGVGLKDFCAALTERNIPYILTGSSIDMRAPMADAVELAA